MMQHSSPEVSWSLPALQAKQQKTFFHEILRQRLSIKSFNNQNEMLKLHRAFQGKMEITWDVIFLTSCKTSNKTIAAESWENPKLYDPQKLSTINISCTLANPQLKVHQ